MRKKESTGKSSSTRRKAPSAGRVKSGSEASPEASGSNGITPERRHAMIAELAYLRAERRGFDGGDPLVDWLEGEREVDRLLTRRPD